MLSKNFLYAAAACGAIFIVASASLFMHIFSPQITVLLFGASMAGYLMLLRSVGMPWSELRSEIGWVALGVTLVLVFDQWWILLGSWILLAIAVFTMSLSVAIVWVRAVMLSRVASVSNVSVTALLAGSSAGESDLAEVLFTHGVNPGDVLEDLVSVSASPDWTREFYSDVLGVYAPKDAFSDE